METAPDEIHYNKDFRKLRKEGNELILLDFLEQPSFSIDINELSNGRIHITCLQNTLLNWQHKYKDTIKRITW